MQSLSGAEEPNPGSHVPMFDELAIVSGHVAFPKSSTEQKTA